MLMICVSFKESVTYEMNGDNLIVRDPAVVREESGSYFITGRNDEEPFGMCSWRSEMG